MANKYNTIQYNDLAKVVKWLSCVVSTYLYGAFDYVIIMSRTSFRVNPNSIVCLNVKDLLARSRCHICCLSNSNGSIIWLTSLAKWLSVRLQNKWLWVRITLLSFKLQIYCLLRARSSLTFRQTIGCGFTLKLVRDMTITYSQIRTVVELMYLKLTLPIA